ncbi:MAG: FAD-dependent thymidylate synthase [Nitrospinota bacterium]|nr:FAD-dependent thymidylate synthase [Nitrospinota bacterium]
MKFTKPYFLIEDEIDGSKILNKLERAGRTCYKSEDRITEESSPKFVKSILDRGHESVIEHESVSVRIICDRGVTHEIVRHRLASYSQESTRYCNYGKADGVTFVIPPFLRQLEIIEPGVNYKLDDIIQVFKESAVDQKDDVSIEWFVAMAQAEKTYNNMLALGMSPQYARSVLPNSLKTEIVMSCNLREWRHFFNLRTAKAAHPQMREIAVPLLKEFQNLIPIIFDDIEPFEGE